MRKLEYYGMWMLLFLLSACNVYEWPETAESVKLHLRLKYETDMTLWEYSYNGVAVEEKGLGDTYDNRQHVGKIRYIIRTYPISEKQRTAYNYTQEFVITKDMAEGYDHEVTLNLLPGSYTIMVWSDLLNTTSDSYFYDANNFAEIKLQGNYQGNTHHRDAFRGMNNITLVADVKEHQPDTLNVTMQRPLAKFEFITTDLKKFIDKELQILAKEAETRGEMIPTKIDTKNYKVVMQYASFMPNTYNMMTDKPIDSATGVFFESALDVLNEEEASLGFDYVFVNGSEAGVSVQIGLYDKGNRQLGFTEPINVPLRRNRHTLVKGSFLMQQASGGITIDSDFDGNHNIIIE